MGSIESKLKARLHGMQAKGRDVRLQRQYTTTGGYSRPSGTTAYHRARVLVDGKQQSWWFQPAEQRWRKA
jgi:hypothetical protein